MWEYVKGSEADFEGCEEHITQIRMRKKDGAIYKLTVTRNGDDGFTDIIAQRRKVDSLQSRVNDANLWQGVSKAERIRRETWSAVSGEQFDTVQRPAHYNQSGIECIDAIAASMTPAEFQAYLKGNVQKYLWRYQHKNGVEDCRKAQWYLDRLVKELSK